MSLFDTAVQWSCVGVYSVCAGYSLQVQTVQYSNVYMHKYEYSKCGQYVYKGCILSTPSLSPSLLL